MDSKDIRIGTWNANGILNRKEELLIYLKENKIDVCFVSETHLIKQCHIRLNGYNIHHTIHPDNQARGGSAVCIRNNFKYNEDSHIQMNETQLTVLNVTSSTYDFKVGAIYLPPRYNLKENDYLTILNHMGERFVIGGDFNAKGSRCDNTKGKELKKRLKDWDA